MDKPLRILVVEDEEAIRTSLADVLVYHGYDVDSAADGPNGLDKAEILPEAATWFSDLSEFVLPYDAVRSADDPEAGLTEFLQSTFAAAARLGNWDLEQYRRRHFPAT